MDLFSIVFQEEKAGKDFYSLHTEVAVSKKSVDGARIRPFLSVKFLFRGRFK